ncbi:MAG TPA: hypothetical protein VNF45_07335, partial [Candidatus Binataceae bacterium]|nr:hypothetical protein [Candidatus Binataceae bacterium]
RDPALAAIKNPLFLIRTLWHCFAATSLMVYRAVQSPSTAKLVRGQQLSGLRWFAGLELSPRPVDTAPHSRFQCALLFDRRTGTMDAHAAI